MSTGAQAAIEERDGVSCTSEEFDSFATRIALLVAKTPHIDRFCAQIEDLLKNAAKKKTA